jgi:hypothetical protein
MPLLAPLFIKAIEYWLSKKVKDAEVLYRWNLFIRVLETKGYISANLKSDYDRQLEELEKRSPDT